jgi:hypothetical protein
MRVSAHQCSETVARVGPESGCLSCDALDCHCSCDSCDMSGARGAEHHHTPYVALAHAAPPRDETRAPCAWRESRIASTLGLLVQTSRALGVLRHARLLAGQRRVLLTPLVVRDGGGDGG